MRNILINLSNKKFMLIGFLVVLFIYQPNLHAQKFEITPYYGFQFNGKVTGYYGDLNLRDAAMYGGSIDIKVQKSMEIELFYSRSDTRADFVEYRGPTYKLTDVSVNYFQIGVVRHAMKKDNVVLYGVGSLGATLLSPSGTPYDETPEKYYFDNYWLFSLTLGGGAKIFLSDRVGIRLEGRFMIPITWAGGGFMVGTGGSGFYLGGGSAILQAGLSAGLIVALGK